MVNITPFEKILTIRTTEKDMALKEYQQSVEQFETVGMELYNLLKEKESLEVELNNKMQHHISIGDIHNYQHYLTQLQQNIDIANRKVQSAREAMEEKKSKLSKSYVEMKKFEKIVDSKKKAIHDKLAKLENDQLNEVSIQQFLRMRKR